MSTHETKDDPTVPPDIETLILQLRCQKVILNADLASIYGIPPKFLIGR